MSVSLSVANRLKKCFMKCFWFVGHISTGSKRVKVLQILINCSMCVNFTLERNWNNLRHDFIINNEGVHVKAWFWSAFKPKTKVKEYQFWFHLVHLVLWHKTNKEVRADLSYPTFLSFCLPNIGTLAPSLIYMFMVMIDSNLKSLKFY